jgi:SAM-dependent methyltransferase
MAPDSDAAKVSEFWGRDRRSERKHNWLEHPTALECLNQRRAGDPHTDLAAYWRRDFLKSPAPLALSIGCGFGLWERIALQQNLASKIDAYDVSENAITEARKLAVEAGLGGRVNYAVTDLNTIDLPADHYDAIFGISSLHHVQNLERLFEQCRRALKPDGLFFIDEYVGPKRFQSNPRVVQIINDVIHLLPEKYRRSVYLNGEPRNTYANTPLAWFDETDPSEAIRSDEILPCLKQHFDVVDEKPYGGALLHMLLSGTAGNFDPTSDEDAALIRLLAFFEEELEKAGAIGTDFATVVAKPCL